MEDSGIDRLAYAYEDVADLYEAGRPSYPDEAVDLLAEQLGIGTGSTVVDLGAGTGKLTRQLVATGAKVVAVEPISGMCRVLQRAAPGAEVINGAASHLPFLECSVDVVTAGQAFQWFGRAAEVSEIRRVLRPRGGIGLIWNRRDRSLPVWKEIETVIAPLRPTRPGHAQWRGPLLAAGFAPINEATLVFDHEATPSQVTMRVASMSWIAALPSRERSLLLERVSAVAVQHATDGSVSLRENTEVAWASRG